MEKEQPTSSQPEPEQKLTESLPAAAADEDTVELEQLLATQLNLGNSNADNEPYEIGVGDLSLDGLLKQWNTKGFRKIITMVGAGISTSAGIPDFRSPGTGLYDNLQKYNLPYPMAIFDINFFRKNPEPFFTLAKELYPGNFNPTASHYFVRLLHEKGLLQRHYTQNIDTLERVAGIPENKLVEAHGTFHNNHCIQCNKAYDKEWVRERVFANQIPKCTKCKNVVKPDIVFFGENLPEIFYKLPQKDFPDCDLLIVMGTSLEVYPFCTLLNEVGTKTPRLVINRTNVLDHEDEANTRDIVFLGDCDDGVWAICKALGWTKQLKKLILRETAILEEQRLWKTSVASSSASSSAIELNNELSKTENDKEKKKK